MATPEDALAEALAEIGRWIDEMDTVSVEWAPAHSAPYVSKYVLQPGIEAILKRHFAAAGWTLSKSEPDPTVTLAPAADHVAVRADRPPNERLSVVCRVCGDAESVHVHNGDERIEDYFVVGRGETDFRAAQRWKARALASEPVPPE